MAITKEITILQNSTPIFIHSQSNKTMNTTTPKIFPECYCFATKKPIRHEESKPQAKCTTSVRSFVAGLHILFFFSVNDYNTINIFKKISSVQGFVSLTVIVHKNIIS